MNVRCLFYRVFMPPDHLRISHVLLGTQEQYTPLLLAVQFGYEDCARRLILSSAIQLDERIGGNKVRMRELFRRGDADVNTFQYSSARALSCAWVEPTASAKARWMEFSFVSKTSRMSLAAAVIVCSFLLLERDSPKRETEVL